MPGANIHPSSTGVTGKLDVAWVIPDNNESTQIDTMLRCGPEEEVRVWLDALAAISASVGADVHVRNLASQHRPIVQ